MTGSGADHWVGIKHHCPHGCGSKWGGSIPEGHTIGCPGRPAPPTQEQIDRQNADFTRVRAANAELCRAIAHGEIR